MDLLERAILNRSTVGSPSILTFGDCSLISYAAEDEQSHSTKHTTSSRRNSRKEESGISRM